MATIDIGTNVSAGNAKKLRRITRACDYCHKRSIRCRFSDESESGDTSRCQNCIDFDQPCRFDRAVKRRGAKPRTQLSAIEDVSPKVKVELDYQDFCRTPSIPTTQSPPEWQPILVAPHGVIVQLVEVYLEIIYPHYPWFHRQSLRQLVSTEEYLRSRFKYAAIMALCALTSARVNDRALFNPRWDVQHLTQVSSTIFYAAAVRECGNAGALQQVDFDLLRTCALLSIAAIQYSEFREFQTHLGKYHTLIAMDCLHDENNWPRDIGVVETEMRRRLFWSMYCLDIYSSIVWNGVIRCREQQSNVAYTTELDDDFFNDDDHSLLGTSPSHPLTDGRAPSWIRGWNFVTDLYRITEHVIVNFRDKQHQQQRSFLDDMFGDHIMSSTNNVKNSILTMYSKLPQCFKETQPITFDPNRDRYGFQAANITATVQLLRMILFSSAGANVEERCRIASEVVEAFMRIPIQYLRALSSPLIHHLAGIGTLLGAVFEEQLSENAYLQVRVVLLSLAQLLDILDHNVEPTAAASKLRALVARVDQQVQSQRRGNDHHTAQIRSPHTANPDMLRHVNRSNSDDSHSTPNSGTQSHTSGHNISSGSGRSKNYQQLPFAVNSDLFDHWHWGPDYMQYHGD